MGAEEGFLPVEFVSRSLHETDRIKKSTESEHRKPARGSYLVQVCTGFWGYAFDDLHILDEELTSSFDLSRIGTIRPARAESHVDQALSPGRIKTCGLGVHTGHLTASDEAVRRFLGSKFSYPEIVGKDSQVPESRCLEQFRG